MQASWQGDRQTFCKPLQAHNCGTQRPDSVDKYSRELEVYIQRKRYPAKDLCNIDPVVGDGIVGHHGIKHGELDWLVSLHMKLSDDRISGMGYGI